MRKLQILFIALTVSLLGCGRRKLDPEELDRNRLFAEILKRQDLRTLGDDGLLAVNLSASPDIQVQRWCAIALGRIGNPKALPWLFEAFRSPFATVRATAAFAVGEIEDREPIDLEFRRRHDLTSSELLGLLDDSSIEVRMRATEALGKIGLPAYAVEILRRLETFHYKNTPEERALLGQTLMALARIENPDTVPMIEKIARLEDPQIQWQAANALFRMRAKSARNTFLFLLRSPDPDVRAHAARGLGICGDPSTIGSLTALLGPERQGGYQPLQVRVSAIQALGTMKSAQAIPAIRAALEAEPIVASNPGQVNFAIQAANALGTIGAPEGEEILAKLLKIDGPVANNAIIALGRILKASSRPDRFFELTGAARAKTPAALRAWIQALGELGGPQAQEHLRAILMRAAGGDAASSDVFAIPAALSALSKTEALDLREILDPYLHSLDGVILRAAIGAYKPTSNEKTPWTRIAQIYSAIAPGKDLEAKMAALKALAPWFQEKEVQETARAALQDRQRNVRIAATRLLRKAGASDIPDDFGPSASSETDSTYLMLATSRKDRSLAILETTRGTIEIELFREDAPLTVENFVTLARRGYFDGLSFMRVVPYFVIQGGDPRNNQEGGPGYTIRCEINMRPYERGSLGMALSGKDTGGSQFFITLSPQPHLDGGYTCFGRVISGMPVADRIVAGDRIVRVRIDEDITLFDYRRY